MCSPFERKNTFSISVVMLQMPGAFVFLSFWRAALTSAGDTAVVGQFWFVSMVALAVFVRDGLSGTGR